MGTGPDRHTSAGSIAAEISSALVKLLSDYTGRGPTKARTYLQEDLVTVVMRETLTKAERSLVANGGAEHVLVTRKMFQAAMREDIVGTVQRITGRPVVAFFSDNSIEPDISVEVLLLDEPLPDASHP